MAVSSPYKYVREQVRVWEMGPERYKCRSVYNIPPPSEHRTDRTDGCACIRGNLVTYSGRKPGHVIHLWLCHRCKMQRCCHDLWGAGQQQNMTAGTFTGILKRHRSHVPFSTRLFSSLLFICLLKAARIDSSTAAIIKRKCLWYSQIFPTSTCIIFYTYFFQLLWIFSLSKSVFFLVCVH